MDVKKTMKVLNRKAIAAETVIFREGDIANCAYLLKSGNVQISTYQDGEHFLLTTVRPNQIFGELALIDGSPRSATATAMEPCEVVTVTHDDIRKQLEGGDEFMKYWVAYLTERIRDLSSRVRD